MKKTLYSFVCLCFGLAMFSACQKAEYSPLDNRAFIAQTSTKPNSSAKLTVGNDAVSTGINVRLSQITEADATYTIAVDAAALEKFNQINETSYVLLPESQFTLSSASLKVNAGEAVSESVDLTVSPLTEEMANSGAKYALPLTISLTSGDVDVLDAGKTMVYVIDRVVIQPVPVINYGSYVLGKFGTPAVEFDAWTWECNVNMSLLGTSVGRYNNQAITSVAVSQGTEIYIRFGDAPIRGDILQVKTQGSQMESKTQFAMNTWYHIALVCTGTEISLYVNGELDNTKTLPGAHYQLNTKGADDFSIAATNYFVAKAMVSEWRFWTVARSQAEIQNNMYSCDPSSAGLLGYFKFNEGEGKDYRDSSGKGGSAYSVSLPTWIQNVRIDGKE